MFIIWGPPLLLSSLLLSSIQQLSFSLLSLSLHYLLLVHSHTPSSPLSLSLPLLLFLSSYIHLMTTPLPPLLSLHSSPSFLHPLCTGRLVASGSADNSIKMLDVDRMMSKTALGHQQQDLHPVIRTMYDHSDAVLAIDFHPTVSVLASGSADTTIKFFDYSKPSVKRSYRVIQEVTGARCLSFHPSGDYILVGTDQSTCEWWT